VSKLRLGQILIAKKIINYDQLDLGLTVQEMDDLFDRSPSCS
jgi:hypothetical protein